MKKKIDDFFGLWSVMMDVGGAEGDENRFEELLETISRKEYEGGREAFEELEDELKKVSEPSLRQSLRDAIERAIETSGHVYVAAGFALGGIYEVTEPGARAQVDYLRKRIHGGGVFVMAAKRQAA